MPPKKVAPPPSATGDEGTPSKQESSIRDGINIEDYNLPKSIVTRLAKGVLPPNTQIQGNAMLAMTKSATVFVNYIASQANEYAASSNRKVIAPQDVFAALDESQFSDFKQRLEAELAKFNEAQLEKRNAQKSKQANKAAGNSGAGNDDNDGEGDSMMDRDGQPVSKKARLDPDESGMDMSEMTEGYSRADHTADDEEGDDEGDETEEDEEEEDQDQEALEVEDQPEEPEEKEDQDEALDNGDDSE